MNISFEISIDMLTKDSVSVKTEKYFIDGDTKEPIGLPHRMAYINSAENRLEVEKIGEPYSTAIFAVWGEEPTVLPEVIEEEILEGGDIDV